MLQACVLLIRAPSLCPAHQGSSTSFQGRTASSMTYSAAHNHPNLAGMFREEREASKEPAKRREWDSSADSFFPGHNITPSLLKMTKGNIQVRVRHCFTTNLTTGTFLPLLTPLASASNPGPIYPPFPGPNPTRPLHTPSPSSAHALSCSGSFKVTMFSSNFTFCRQKPSLPRSPLSSQTPSQCHTKDVTDV